MTWCDLEKSKILPVMQWPTVLVSNVTLSSDTRSTVLRNGNGKRKAQENLVYGTEHAIIIYKYHTLAATGHPQISYKPSAHLEDRHLQTPSSSQLFTALLEAQRSPAGGGPRIPRLSGNSPRSRHVFSAS